MLVFSTIIFFWSHLFNIPPQKFDIDQIVVLKQKRIMYLINDKKIVRRYKIGLGFSPAGHKSYEGDGKTPEGNYYIDRRNPNSAYYLSIGISYPDARDKAAAKKNKKSPGGDIFIHGHKWFNFNPNSSDWTAGCIAVRNKDMREIFHNVKLRTPIKIYP